MKITRRMIADKAGVSPATVSRYYNGTADLGEDTVKKIKEALLELGSEEVQQNTPKKIIMILLTQLHIPFYQRAVDELLGLENSSYTFVLFHYSPRSPETVKNFVSKVKPSGVIYFEEEIDETILGFLQGRGIRTVMFGGIVPDYRADMIRVNDIAAAYEGTRYLLGLGHTEILFLSDEVYKIGAGFQRLTGSQRAIEERGLRLNREMVSFSEVTFEAGYQAVSEALKQKKRFTAVFAFSDELAVGAMAALIDEGIRVPEEVSVLGYDDLDIAVKVRPALTTIHQPMDGFVQKVLELFEQPLTEMKVEILLPYKIIERNSCGRRPAARETAWNRAEQKREVTTG